MLGGLFKTSPLEFPGRDFVDRLTVRSTDPGVRTRPIGKTVLLGI